MAEIQPADPLNPNLPPPLPVLGEGNLAVPCRREASPASPASGGQGGLLRPSGGNPFRRSPPDESAHPEQYVHSTYGLPAFPMQKLEVVIKDNFDLWKVKLQLAAHNMRCIRAFEMDMEGKPENYAAMALLLSGVPALWQKRIIAKGSAFKGVQYVLDQFDGGKNSFYVEELERDMQTLKIGESETYEEFVCRASNLADSLESNGRPVSHGLLVQRIVNGLPDMFDSSKSSLRINGKSWSIEQLTAEIKSEGFNLKSSKSGLSDVFAMLAIEESNPTWKSNVQGNGGGKGKFTGVCWHCGKKGHFARECRGPNKDFAFKPETKEEDVSAEEVGES